MTLYDIGYSSFFEQHRQDSNSATLQVARVSAVLGERYHILTPNREYKAEVTGHLLYTSGDRTLLPVAGDWVCVSLFEPDFALIHRVLPRKTQLSRRAAGERTGEQVLAANVDTALLVQSANQDFNLNRLERYRALCVSSGVLPVVVLTKTDQATASDVTERLQLLDQRLKDVPVFPLSNMTGKGVANLRHHLIPAQTYCLLGSSGVGKSSLLNTLCGENRMRTGPVSEHLQKGRHVTTHRELIRTPSGILLIDNPGMRELGLIETGDAVVQSFDKLDSLRLQCRYADCSHRSEPGCAVRLAVENGQLDEAAYQNFLKLEKERTFYESSLLERRQNDKAFGKRMHQYLKNNPKK